MYHGASSATACSACAASAEDEGTSDESSPEDASEEPSPVTSTRVSPGRTIPSSRADCSMPSWERYLSTSACRLSLYALRTSYWRLRMSPVRHAA